MKPIEYPSFGPQEDPLVIKSSNRLHVLSVPISLQAHIIGDKMKFFVSAGISPGYMSRYTTYSKFNYPDGSTSTSNSYSVNAQKNFKDFVLGAHLSGGIDYQYSAKASMRIAPVIRTTVNNVYVPGEIRANYFNVGIEFGTVYKL